MNSPVFNGRWRKARPTQSHAASGRTSTLALAVGFTLIAFGFAGASIAAGAQPGLIGVVYGDTGMTRPAERISVPRLDERIAVWPKQRDGSIRIRGSITAPVSGTGELRVETSQRVRLSVAGRKLLDVGSEGGSASFEFRAGQPEPIVVEYVQPALPSLLRVSWRLPGGGFEPVPESALSHDRSDLAAADAAGARPGREDLLTVANPNPSRLASLRVWRTPKELLVEASIPAVEGFTCNSWCYEGEMDFVDCRDLGDGRLELRHRLTKTPEVLVVTTVIPDFDSIDFVARLEREDGKGGPFPEHIPAPNLCWQLKASPAFASGADPYPEFYARCFIFTEQGQTFLDKTTRRKIPAKPADVPENNPPWVQIYGPANEPPKRSEPGAWADFSAERFTVPVIGNVSRDGKHLVAIASPSATSLCQAWHDCMHISSNWESRTWRLKVYAMENDAAKLLEAFRRDFPANDGTPGTSPGSSVAPSSR
ncbi:MAG TPA: PA14 domain-containing protein [Opitutaceae bacterium]